MQLTYRNNPPTIWTKNGKSKVKGEKEDFGEKPTFVSQTD